MSRKERRNREVKKERTERIRERKEGGGRREENDEGERQKHRADATKISESKFLYDKRARRREGEQGSRILRREGPGILGGN